MAGSSAHRNIIKHLLYVLVNNTTCFPSCETCTALEIKGRGTPLSRKCEAGSFRDGSVCIEGGRVMEYGFHCSCAPKWKKRSDKL